MALLDSSQFEWITKNRNSIHKATYAVYTSFINGENKYLQIDTYGSDDRMMKDKVSQSIQIDKSMAEKLIAVLKHEFKL